MSFSFLVICITIVFFGVNQKKIKAVEKEPLKMFPPFGTLSDMKYVTSCQIWKTFLRKFVYYFQV